MSGFRKFLENLRVERGLPKAMPGTFVVIKTNAGVEILSGNTKKEDITKKILGSRGMVTVQVNGPSGKPINGGDSMFFVYGDNCANPVRIRGEDIDTRRKIRLHK